MQKILIIVGPTASGKSALAVELAKKFNGEVISADSRQVYKGLDIGTGKITKKEMQGVPHHLLDVANPKKVFTAADFLTLGKKAIEDILSRGKLPIICGGTGFYIDALVGRISVPEVPPNASLRRTLEKKPVNDLYEMLRNMDPVRAATIDTQNPVRLIRAIEIATALGSVPNIKTKSPYDALWIGIQWPEEALNERIAIRLSTRMKQGMLAEAKRLHASGLSYTRMEDLGLEYASLSRFLRGKIDRKEMLERILLDSRQYAKRQVQYWKRNTGITWIPAPAYSRATTLVTQFLNGTTTRRR